MQLNIVTIDFLASGSTENMYKKPSKLEIVDVDNKFLFTKIDGSCLIPTCGGRFLKLTNASDVKHKYEEFRRFYF